MPFFFGREKRLLFLKVCFDKKSCLSVRHCYRLLSLRVRPWQVARQSGMRCFIGKRFLASWRGMGGLLFLALYFICSTSGKESAISLSMLWRKAVPFSKALLSATFPQGATVAGRKTTGYAVLYREVVLGFVEGRLCFCLKVGGRGAAASRENARRSRSIFQMCALAHI